MKNKPFKPYRICQVCPHFQEQENKLQLVSKQSVIYKWRCIVWGRVIECVSRADALAELHRQCQIEVAFARHSRPLSMAEYLHLSTRFVFAVDDIAGTASINGKPYGKIIPENFGNETKANKR